MAIVTKLEAWQKVNKLDISIFKKEIIFYNIYEYELKEFMETEKNTKNLKTLVNTLIVNNKTIDNIKKVLINKRDIIMPIEYKKIGRYDDNYILYIDIK